MSMFVITVNSNPPDKEASVSSRKLFLQKIGKCCQLF